MLKSFRYLLFPFALLYWCAIKLRNWLFDKNILKSATFNFPLICVGNLAVGGTGKTPMTEYLVSLLKNNYRTATLSRGYKRKTKGYAIASASTTAIDIGDEPMQIHQKFPEIIVAVGEERLVAIPHLLQDHPDTDVIILDDAFQHRSIHAGLNILLTEYKNLYTRDLMFPVGDLRDTRSSAARAEVIVVTKCPKDLSVQERNEIVQELDPQKHQHVFFSALEYLRPKHLFSREEIALKQSQDILLVTGIANPKPLKDFLITQVHSYDMLRYNDHHIFKIDDLKEIKKHYELLTGNEKLILTTEKDGVRLEKFGAELSSYPVFVIPMGHTILFSQKEEFQSLVLNYVAAMKQKFDREPN